LISSSPYSPRRVRAPSTKWGNSSFDGGSFKPSSSYADLLSIRTANARTSARTSANDNSVSVVTAATLAQASRAAIKQRARSRRKVGRPTMQDSCAFHQDLNATQVNDVLQYQDQCVQRGIRKASKPKDNKCKMLFVAGAPVAAAASNGASLRRTSVLAHGTLASLKGNAPTIQSSSQFSNSYTKFVPSTARKIEEHLCAAGEERDLNVMAKGRREGRMKRGCNVRPILCGFRCLAIKRRNVEKERRRDIYAITNEATSLERVKWKKFYEDTHAVERCEGETRRWSTAEERPFRLVSADKNLRVGRTEKEEERKLQEAEAIDGREVKRRRRSQQKSFCPPSRTIVYTTSPILGGERRLSGPEGREMKRAAKETRVKAGDPGEHGGAEVSGKLNLAQDVTAPGNTGASVR
ncbi:hypothetical protein ALC56_05183, partial [Trachymyrmex septentrionalis]